MVQHIYTANGIPSRLPEYIGQEYFDQSTQQFYKAIGPNATDWRLLGTNGISTAEAHIVEHMEGPWTIELNPNTAIYTLNMGGAGPKFINLPSGLDATKRYSFIVIARNTEGGPINVQIGSGTNVIWEGDSQPIFPTDNVIVEMMLFTLDGGNKWFGRVLATYSD